MSTNANAGADASGIARLLPIPHTTEAVTDPGAKQVAASMSETPSLSHALAQDDHETKGEAQEDHDYEVKDLGWNEPKQEIAAPLVGGMDNEELWLLVRRFNKQMYHVKSFPYAVPGGLDLNIADEEEFSPDKLRANIERLYMTVLVGVMGFGKHIVRLRSWRETRRTSCFAAAYLVAWMFDFLVPLLAVTLITLIAFPPSRGLLFPPAPLALVSSKGGVQKPKAGVLGSHDSVTGAPENHKGEAVEQEASNFVNGIASVALSSASGKHPQSDPNDKDGAASSLTPDPTALPSSAADAKDKAAGVKPGASHDKTKVPMETAMWTKMRPIMHGIADFTDGWERFANALSPTPPFPRDTDRLRLAMVIIPLFGLSLFVTSYMFMKAVTFGIGFGFFGDPVISRGITLLNKYVPNWPKLLELRNTLLKGVPTNAQLTITLLRIGEANRAPLPPPPHIGSPPSSEPAEISEANFRTTGAEPPLSATEAELDAAIQNDPTVPHETDGADIDAAKDSKHGKKGQKVLGFFRSAAKGLVKTAAGTDTVRAKTTGSSAARDRLGAIPPAGEIAISGPVEFKGRYKGKKGALYITAKATIPSVGFSTERGVMDKDDAEKGVHADWTIALADITELKKVGGYGWKAKLVVGWALGREVADGLEITTATGETHKVTAMPLRDELFNRLVAMGGQKWEAW